jgi:hypothetical protein
MPTHAMKLHEWGTRIFVWIQHPANPHLFEIWGPHICGEGEKQVPPLRAKALRSE